MDQQEAMLKQVVVVEVKCIEVEDCLAGIEDGIKNIYEGNIERSMHEQVLNGLERKTEFVIEELKRMMKILDNLSRTGEHQSCRIKISSVHEGITKSLNEAYNVFKKVSNLIKDGVEDESSDSENSLESGISENTVEMQVGEKSTEPKNLANTETRKEKRPEVNNESVVDKSTTGENILRNEQETQCPKMTLRKKAPVKLKFKDAEDHIHSIEKKQSKSKLLQRNKPGRPKKLKFVSKKGTHNFKPTNDGEETLKLKTMKESPVDLPQDWGFAIVAAIKNIKSNKKAANLERISKEIGKCLSLNILDKSVEMRLVNAVQDGLIESGKVDKLGNATYRIAAR